MKNTKFSRLGGFTLIELLVVVLIVGILVAMVLPQYNKAVERARMAEALTLMDRVVRAQRHKFMQTNRYAYYFDTLGVAKVHSHTSSIYHTKGHPRTGAGGNGFAVAMFFGGFLASSVVAERELNGRALNPSLRYKYSLHRYFQADEVMCEAHNSAAEELCADFCGIDTPVNRCCNNGSKYFCPWPTNY